MSTCGSELGSWACHMNVYIYKTQEVEDKSCCCCVLVSNPEQLKIILKTTLISPQCQTLQMLILNSLIAADGEI